MSFEYQVQLIRFPNYKIKEAVTLNEDGSYTIFIEESLSRDQQKEMFQHAMHHIKNGDFNKENVQEIEYNAHREC